MSFLKAYHGKKVFLTGHTGFKGSWMSQWLLHLGAKIVGYSKDIPTEPSIFESLKLSEHLEDLRADIRDQDFLEKSLAAAKPDIVFHFAAQPLVRASYEAPLATFHENTFGTAQVLEAVRKIGNIPAMVVVTTDKVYENCGWEFGYRENDPLGGHDPYSASKAAAEIIFSSYARSFFTQGTRLCSARAGNVIGGGDWAKDRIVPDCIRAWQKKNAVEIRNPTFTRPWEHVLEPLGGYLLLGQRLLESPDQVHGEAFNFGPSGSQDRTTLELVKALSEAWGGGDYSIQGSLDKKTEKKEAGALRLNCDRSLARLGWLPYLSFEKTVRWTADWYAAFCHGKSDLGELTLSQIRDFEQGVRGFPRKLS